MHELTEDHYQCRTARLTGCPVVLFHFWGAVNTPDLQNVLFLVRKNSASLLFRDHDSNWSQECEKGFSIDVRNAALLKGRSGPDMLALSMADGAIYFLQYVDGELEVVREVRDSLLDSDALSLSGHHIAVDVKCRAMCSLSYEDRVILYTTKRTSQTIDLTARRKIVLNGILQNCCFLYNQGDIISLVVHVSRQGGSRLMLIHWRQDDLLERIEPRYMPLDASLSICLHMISLSKKPGFFLHVTADCLSLISEHHLQSGDLRFDQCRLNISNALPSSAVELAHGNTGDLALLAFDDGQIFLATNAHGYLTTESMGSFDFPASAMSVIGSPHHLEEDCYLVFVTGDHGESGVYQLKPNSESVNMALFNELSLCSDLLIAAKAGTKSNSVMTTGGSRYFGEVCMHSSGLPSVPKHEIQILEFGNTAPKQLFGARDLYGSSYILLSLPWSSELFQCSFDEEPQLLDVTSDYGVITDSPTLLFFAYNGIFMQVTSNSIQVCKESQESRTKYNICSEGETITLVTASHGKLALIICRGSLYYLRVLTLLKTEYGDYAPLQVGQDWEYEDEPLCISSASPEHQKDTTYLLLGFSDSKVVLLHLSWNNNSTLSEIEYKLDTVDSGLDTVSSQPHSCAIVFENQCVQVMVGLRSGMVVHLRLLDEMLEQVDSLALSNAPVTFHSNDSESAVEVYYLGDDLGLLTLSGGFMHSEIIGMQRSPQDAVVPVKDPFFDSSLQSSPLSGLLCLAAGIISFVVISNKPTAISERVKVEESPRRLLYIESQDCLLVATNRLTAFDPTDKDPSKYIANLKIMKGGRCISESPIRDSKKQSMLFRPGDTIYAMIQWDVTINGRERSWTIIGSSRRITRSGRSDAQTLEGRLTVLRLKTKSSKVDVRKEFSPSFPNPIYALCPFGPLSLIISHGCTIELSSLDIESRTLASQVTITLRSPAVSITTIDGFIFLATQKDSVLVYEYLPDLKKLQRVSADPYPRASVSMVASPLLLSPHNRPEEGGEGEGGGEKSRTFMIFLSDKFKNVFMYQWTSNTTTLQPLGHLTFPTVLVRLQIYHAPKFHHRRHGSRDAIDGLMRVLVPDDWIVVGAGLDGSLHALVRIHAVLEGVLRELDGSRGGEEGTASVVGLWRGADAMELVREMSDAQVDLLVGVVGVGGEGVDRGEFRRRLAVVLKHRSTRALA